MDASSLDRLRSAVRDVQDFPQPGVLFKDITPVRADSALLSLAVDGMAEAADGQRVDKVVGIDARGFIFGAMLAARLGCGFIPARKKGKLPWRTSGVDYALEYGTASLEMHEDAIHPGEKVLLADDLLATGGTDDADEGGRAGLGVLHRTRFPQGAREGGEVWAGERGADVLR